METSSKGSYAENIPSAVGNSVFLSVIVPVYNVENYLEKCVFSLLEQDPVESGWEILLIDDGSTDQSGRLCDELASRSLNVKVFHKENGGLSSARNYGLKRAGGTYVLFVDSDDFVEHTLFHILWEKVRKYEWADVICFDGTEHSEDDEKHIRRVPFTEESCRENGRTYLNKKYRDRNFNVEAWLYAYRRAFLTEHGFQFVEGRLHEDVEFTPRVILASERIVELPDSLYHYVVRENSISTQKNKEKNIRDLFLTLKEQCVMAEEQPPELKKWMKDAALNRYLNMVYYARMYEPRYRKLFDRRFLFGKAATNWNRFRVLVCFLNVRLYCWMNDCYKKVKS